jgi:hypothetical protein
MSRNTIIGSLGFFKDRIVWQAEGVSSFQEGPSSIELVKKKSLNYPCAQLNS